MRVRPVGCNYGSGPDREKRPVHRLPITGRKGKGGFNLLPASLHDEGRKQHGRVWHRLPIANSTEPLPKMCSPSITPRRNR